MNTNTDSNLDSVNNAIKALQNGQLVILVDDEDRENEGDLVFPASMVTPNIINFMATYARGLICLSLTSKRVKELNLQMMTTQNNSPKKTAFTVSIEAKEGVTTGISAFDRAKTIQAAVDPLKGSADIISPGHIFPLQAVEGGVLVRAGHTEGSIDLMKLAGLPQNAVICEIMNEDGTMARMDDLKKFSLQHQIPIVSIKDVISMRMQNETLVKEEANAELPSVFGNKPFRVYAFKSLLDDSEHLALVCGQPGPSTLVRVHSECLTGDALGSMRCDCGSQLQAALKQISENPEGGILVYMKKHEGRGIGLINKIKAYQLQDQGMDTVEANFHLGFGADLRQYGLGAQILRQLGVKKIKLLTNNPRKIIGLQGYGLEVIQRVPLELVPNPKNQNYLNTKKSKLGHLLELQNETR